VVRRIYITSLLIICSLIFAQSNEPDIKVRRVIVHGNVHFSDEEIGRAVNSKQPLTCESVLKSILIFYGRRGFYFARIDSFHTISVQNDKSVDLEVWIDEAVRIGVRSISFEGNRYFSDRFYYRLMNTRNGDLLDEKRLSEDIEAILNSLENKGHPLAEIEIKEVVLDTAAAHPGIDIVLKITEGPPVTIGSIKIKGNRFTKERVILREMRLRKGRRFSRSSVERAFMNLKRSGYFKEVKEQTVIFERDKAHLTFTVIEGNTNSIDGVIGYQPASRESKRGYFTGRLKFDFRNLLGTGRILEAFWEKKDRYSQAMRFGYKEPWFIGMPIDIGGYFSQQIRDTTYIEREWNLSIDYNPISSLSLFVRGGYREVLPDSLGSQLFNIAHSRSWRFSLGLDYLTFDNLLNPSRGVRYHTLITIGRKKNIGPEFLKENDEWKGIVSTRSVEIDAEAVFPVFRNQVLYLGMHGREIRTGERYIPLSDQIRFGGATTLRGYAEDSFMGDLVAWLNSEYRLLVGRLSRFFIFIDGGMYQRKDREAGIIRTTKIGYGFGMRVETRLGLIGIDYGLGEQDTILRGKVHVSLVNHF